MQDYKSHSIVLLHGVLADEAWRKIKCAQTTPVFVLEGRPSLLAAHVNTKVLLKNRLRPTVIADNMAGFLFYKGLVKEVVLACQYADNTGALCDMGALILAVLAKKHKVSVRLLPGQHKNRFLGDPKEILSFNGKRLAPLGVKGYVPLVEWVPEKYLK
ncbi:MAG: hypothetical protein HY209_05005 [Candidatus Omnitrophica bacterium]|nr:hypothetical protein [Candidatus Omnitrophota bacterium]